MSVQIEKDNRWSGCYWIYSEDKIIASIHALDENGHIQGRNEYRLDVYTRPFDTIDFIKEEREDYCNCLHIGTLPQCKKLAQQLSQLAQQL
jgi:hypothetical protein